MSRVLVTGGRDYDGHRFVANALTQCNRAMGIDTLIVGDCPTGVDKFARDWAHFHGVPCEVFEADWKKHGKAAGPIRNKTMLVDGNPSVVLAFPGGKGTANMTALARDAGVKVYEMKQQAEKARKGG